MSSIWKDERSPYWTACFTAHVGHSTRQLKLSTGTKDREQAKLIAIKLEEAGRGGMSSVQIKSFLEEIDDKKIQGRLHRAFDAVLRLVNGNGLESRTARTYVQSWLNRTQGQVARPTFERYKKVAEQFLDSLQGKADQDICLVTQEDICRFRDEEAKRVKPSTVNISLKVVRIIFAAAESSNVINRNEARFVKPLKTRDTVRGRRAFTLDELKAILEACTPEWKSLVLMGFYTGARLGDLALMTWENIDLNRNELRYQSNKTGRSTIVPLAKPLRQHIDSLPVTDNPKQPIHPRAHEIVSRQGRVSTLSNHFQEILVSAGLAKARSHQAAGEEKSKGETSPGKARDKRNGRAGQREQSDISFHALRHSAVTMLKLAGVGEVVAMDLVGHDSAEISRHYTHVDFQSKQDAVDKLPDVMAREASEKNTHAQQ